MDANQGEKNLHVDNGTSSVSQDVLHQNKCAGDDSSRISTIKTDEAVVESEPKLACSSEKDISLDPFQCYW